MNVCKICGDPCPDSYDTCWLHRHDSALNEHDKRLNDQIESSNDQIEPRPRDKPTCGIDGCEINFSEEIRI